MVIVIDSSIMVFMPPLMEIDFGFQIMDEKVKNALVLSVI
jgi:hypothetical protein